MINLEEYTVPGLHDFLIRSILRRFGVIRAGQAIDLGGGSGSLALRLRQLGFRVLAVDVNSERFQANAPFALLDLDKPDFATALGEGQFDLVTAVEVIEHLESPIGFLRGVSRVLKGNGFAVVTTPNLDNIAARLKHLAFGKLRTMDEKSPEHISPIFYDLFVRQYLPRAGLSLVEHTVYPKNDFPLTGTRWLVPMFRTLARVVGGPAISGDCHVFLLRRPSPS